MNEVCSNHLTHRQLQQHYNRKIGLFIDMDEINLSYSALNLRVGIFFFK